MSIVGGPAFAVHNSQVEAVRRLVAELVEASSNVHLTVTGEEFPVWLAAMNATVFHSLRSPSGWPYAYAHCVVPSQRFGHVLVWVSTHERPAPWVVFPTGEATKRWEFNYTKDMK